MPSGSEETSANDLNGGIGRGLEFLRRSQLPSGEFKVYVSPDSICNMIVCLTVHHFPPRLLLYWLDFDDKANMDVLSKALRFLLNVRACYR